MAKWSLLITGWIAFVVNGATNGLDGLLGTRNVLGFYALNVIACALGAITLGVQLRERIAGRGSCRTHRFVNVAHHADYRLGHRRKAYVVGCHARRITTARPTDVATVKRRILVERHEIVVAATRS